MNREKKTLLNIQLLLQYYKNDNILDRYHRIIENGIIFDNEILDEIQPNIYVVKYNKYIKLEKEIDRLNNIIDEFEDWLEKQRIRNSEWDNFVIKDTRLGIPITYLLDKLKALKENNNE